MGNKNCRKSSINHKLRKIEKIAKHLRKNGYEEAGYELEELAVEIKIQVERKRKFFSEVYPEV